MPQYETIATYDTSNGQNMEPVMEYEDMVLFGVHTCDLAGIQCLNIVFSQQPKDTNYLMRKNRILIIGYECNSYCDEYASCRLVYNHLPNGGYDLFFTNLENGSFIIHINTLIGEELVKKGVDHLKNVVVQIRSDNSGNTLIREELVKKVKIFKEANDSDLQMLEDLRERKRKIFAKNEVPIEHEKIPELFDKVLYQILIACKGLDLI